MNAAVPEGPLEVNSKQMRGAVGWMIHGIENAADAEKERYLRKSKSEG